MTIARGDATEPTPSHPPNRLRNEEPLVLHRRQIQGSIDPLTVFASSTAYHRSYWCIPNSDIEITAIGAARTLRAQTRKRRFSEIQDGLRELDISVEGDDGPTCTGIILVGGFAFSNEELGHCPAWGAFGAGELTVPELLVVRQGGHAWMTTNGRIELDELNTPIDHHLGTITTIDHRRDEAYVDLVSNALGEIRMGQFDKLVTARSITTPAKLRPGALLAKLRHRFPECATFALGRGTETFLGASPERLISVTGQRVETDALAGSRPRHPHPGRDAQLRSELLASPKERTEHQIVVDAIRSILSDANVNLDAIEPTDVMKLKRIQHLRTPIGGTLTGDAGHVLDLMAALHPTPAVAGLPRREAQDWINRHEPMDRGWYSGPVGWSTLDGDGEFRVALRSALLTANDITLFAGGGIIEGSEPHAELAETATKFEALLGALGVIP